MTYRLKYDPAAEAVYDALPQHVSEQLTLALADACDDPIGATRPYGDIEDEVIRRVVAGDVTALLLVGHNMKTLTVLEITYLG
ncbi:type II toxin-antitoxin system RelE/ParE family toxin [Streptomyces sp. DH37]|uniref:type II toxin-antitoxin system RelE family toxin n=1 Tax=Streptomyces sp. DH37 TaxID=3040122 RepID=UPI0024432CF8|nr:hypothetical protein [Streptomyces sp. DH37]MDG9701696.1 hypothetical protein [Streptomyces sp. DH37]